MIYSYTRLRKFESCPYAFYQKYILERPDPPGEAAVLGKAVHRAVELSLVDNLQLDVALNVAGKEAEGPFSLTDARCLALKALNWLYREVAAGCIDGSAVYVENQFSLPLDGPGSPEIQGYIDLHDGKSIVDWKTNRRPYSHDANHQLGIYAWAVSRIFGLKEIPCRLYFLRSGSVSEGLYTQEKFEAARTWALQLALDIENRLVSLYAAEGSVVTETARIAEYFPANSRSGECRWCAWAGECPAMHRMKLPVVGQAAVPAGAITSSEEAVRVAVEIERLETVLNDLKGRLHAWVSSRGPVVAEDKVWDNYPTISWSFSPESLRRLCRDIAASGKDPFAYLSLGASGIKKLGWPEEVLARYGSKETRTSFRAKKLKSIKKKEGVA